MDKIHNPDENWLVRGCIRVSEAVVHVSGSSIRQCEECGMDIWYHDAQPVPEVEGIVFDGQVMLCMQCMVLHQESQTEPPIWIGPKPDDFRI
jgi:Zn-finger protein